MFARFFLESWNPELIIRINKLQNHLSKIPEHILEKNCRGQLPKVKEAFALPIPVELTGKQQASTISSSSSSSLGHHHHCPSSTQPPSFSSTPSSSSNNRMCSHFLFVHIDKTIVHVYIF